MLLSKWQWKLCRLACTASSLLRILLGADSMVNSQCHQHKMVHKATQPTTEQSISFCVLSSSFSVSFLNCDQIPTRLSTLLFFYLFLCLFLLCLCPNGIVQRSRTYLWAISSRFDSQIPNLTINYQIGALREDAASQSAPSLRFMPSWVGSPFTNINWWTSKFTRLLSQIVVELWPTPVEQTPVEPYAWPAGPWKTSADPTRIIGGH